jgi:hypothetical protein
MARTKETTITINDDKELTFRTTTALHEKFVNDMQLDNKVAPAKNLLRSALVKDDAGENRALLDELIEGGKTMELVGLVVEDFASEVTLSVKK